MGHSHTGSRCWSCRMTMPALPTCALWAAGVLSARRVLAEQRRAHLRLTQHPPAVARALSTGVYVPRFSFHKVLSSRGVANGRGAELWLLHHKVIWGRTQRQNTSSYSSTFTATREGQGGETDHGVPHSVLISRTGKKIFHVQKHEARPEEC